MGGTFLQVINKAVNEKRDIWLYGNGDETALFVENFLERFQIEVKGKIYINEIDEKSIKCIYDLIYEKIKNITVIIAETNYLKIEETCDILDALGFSLQEWNYTAIYNNITVRKGRPQFRPDTFINMTFVYDEAFPGYKVMGNRRETDIRILVYGGSTSAEGAIRQISWVSFLYQKLVKNGYQVTIFNGATPGEAIADEFLRLVRDGICLKPDYVINFSGVNNLGKVKTKNRFCPKYRQPASDEVISGLPSMGDIYDFWCYMSELMILVSGYLGAECFNFLQPMKMGKENMSLFEVSFYDDELTREGASVFRRRAGERAGELYTNLLYMFEDEDGKYVDHDHYSTEANRLIADIVFEALLKKGKLNSL